VDPLVKELFAYCVPLASLGAGAFYFYNGRKHAETKEARLAREKAEAAEKEARAARDKATDDALAHLKSGQATNDRQMELFMKVHADSSARQDHQLSVFIQYAKDQSVQNVEIAKLIERDQARSKTTDNIDEGLKTLTKLVTDYIITERRNAKG
jgi:hypothetical protein